MAIIFNAIGCGLGNNGGSKTIIKSAETLEKLGYDVIIACNINKYTWHKTEVDILGKDHMSISGYNTMVNVSVWDVETTLDFRCNSKVWWLRGWEKWVHGEEYLINQIKKFVKAGGKMIVNSSWLIDQLKEKCGVESQLCFAGLDLDFWMRTPVQQEQVKTVIGALYHKKHKTKNYQMFLDLQKMLDPNKYKFKVLYDKYNNEQLRDFYSGCDVWLSLSSLEGFHQVPAEAALCQCIIIYNDIDSGGTRDYCNPETAIPFKTMGGLIECFENPKKTYILRCNMPNILRIDIGSRETNMKRFVNLIDG